MFSVLIRLVDSLFDGMASINTPGPPLLDESLANSLGAVAAFTGVLALAFAMPASFQTASVRIVFVLTVVGSGFAILGMLAARRARRVSTRNLMLAKLGYILSAVALMGSVLSLSVAVIRALA